MARRRDPLMADHMRRQLQQVEDEMNAERPIRGAPGDDGKDGQPIELTEAGDWLQYRVRGTSTWTPLVSLETLRVHPDPVALQAYVNTWLAAHPPAAGKSVELQATATHLQWRQTGGTWANVVALADMKGAKGDTGPSAKVPLGTLTVAQIATIAINAGVRTISFTGVTGALAGDDLLLFPTSALPAGYAIHNVRCPVTGTVDVTMTAPLLAIGGSFSIPCRLVALR